MLIVFNTVWLLDNVCTTRSTNQNCFTCYIMHWNFNRPYTNLHWYDEAVKQVFPLVARKVDKDAQLASLIMFV